MLRTEPTSSHIELVEGYFDTNAQFWSDVYQKPHYVSDFVLVDRQNIAIDLMSRSLPVGSRILDAGCGAGMATLALLQKGYFVHAVDVSQKMLDLCKEILEHASIPESSYVLSRADLLNSELPENSFDAILALGFLQYQPDEHPALMALNKLLKPGGVLVLSGPVKIKLSEYFGLAKVYYFVKNRLTHPELSPERDVLHRISSHYYGVGRFKKLLGGAGFEMLDYKGHGFINFAILKDFTSRGQHFLHRFFTRLSNYVPIDRFANDMVVAARKKDSNR